MNPTISICIPTYNRRDLLFPLIVHILDISGNFEISVHVDGSEDGSYDCLAAIKDDRLVVTQSANCGRANALLRAIRNANGDFIMLMDDDDSISAEGLAAILRDCQGTLPDGCAGFIYHLQDEHGDLLGDAFPVQRTNFAALRADYCVKGDKKEVVRRDAALSVAFDGAGRYRRVPTSLIWLRMAMKYDVICRNEIVGLKRYMSDGMTSQIWKLKRRDPYPMLLLQVTKCRGYFAGRYKSRSYLMRSFISLVGYGFGCLMKLSALK